MRRNRNFMNRGGHGGGPNMINSGGRGPLLTEHLKDIDLELDLLKRKREMLEKQQFLQPLMQPQGNFNQQPYAFNQSQSLASGSNCDYSHLYNDGPEPMRKPFGKKRHSDADWQHDTSPKRFSGGPRVPGFAPGPAPVRNQRPFNVPHQQYRPPPPRQSQGKQFIGQKIANQKQLQQNSAKNFAPNKITKPNAAPPPNKLASKPIAERASLVAGAVGTEALRLLPGAEPSKLMTGRLELALGCVLQDVRARCKESPYHEALRSAAVLRTIKQEIRNRIRKAMLGKIVSTGPDIVKEYRNMFSKATDSEIVNVALTSIGCGCDLLKVPVKPTPAEVRETASRHYNDNMAKLVDYHLSEMFDKMHEIYNVETEGDTEPAVEDSEVFQCNRKLEKCELTLEEIMAKLEEDKSSPFEYKRMLPRVLKKYIPTIIKMLNLKKSFKRAVGDLDTAARQAVMVDNAPPAQSGGAASGTDASADDQSNKQGNKFVPHNQLPYYVKLMGKPHLPKRRQMSGFLDQFNPKSIKKHRTIHNLLFIGFTEKEDFDKIVKADGTVIARQTLSIKVCDNNTNKPNGDATNSNQNSFIDNRNENNESLNESDGDIIGAELDGQINDLLTSIRNAEEEREQEENEEGTNDTAMNNGEEKPVEASTENCTIKQEPVVTASENAEGNGNTKEPSTEVEQNGTCEAAVKVESQEPEQVIQDSETAQQDSEIAQQDSETAQQDSETGQQDSEMDQEETVPEKETPTEQADVKTTDTKKSEVVENAEVVSEKTDQIKELKTAPTGRSTPTRASSRLANAPATPSSIRTRRASKLMQ